MTARQVAARGIDSPRVLAAMRAVPRHRFVPEEVRGCAYDDRALRIGSAQTISQPYVVAFMTEAAGVRRTDRCLEIGTGSGYQTAVLAELADDVRSVEILPELAAFAEANLAAAGYRRVELRTGDGRRGWPEAAPYDVILATAAPAHVPDALLEQLAPGGRLVLPVGTKEQCIVRITKTAAGLEREELLPVRFVPMTAS